MSSVTHFIRELTMFGSLGSAKSVTRVTVGFSDLFYPIHNSTNNDVRNCRISVYLPRRYFMAEYFGYYVLDNLY